MTDSVGQPATDSPLLFAGSRRRDSGQPQRLRQLGVSLSLLFALSVASELPAQSRPSSLRTDTLWAQSLGVRKSLVVYLPPSYSVSPARRYPVLVYLHGLTGNERNWSEQGALGTTLDSLARAGRGEAIVVMPDGDDGWYTTWNALSDPGCAADTVRKEKAATYCVPWLHYDDYIANDVVRYVDSHYRTRATRDSRGIAGLSMGGYGAITIALRYPHLFAAAASHSGVVSPRLIPSKPSPPMPYATDTIGMRAATGSLWKWMAPPFGRDTIAWLARDPGRMAERLVERRRIRGASFGVSRGASRRESGGVARGTTRAPATGTLAPRIPVLMLDCGTSDRFIDQNRDLHATLTRLGVTHRYAEWPGDHNWAYWRAHAAESAAFLLEQLKAR